jgi:hypothetical protein
VSAVGVGSNQNLHHKRRYETGGGNQSEANVREVELILQVTHESEDDTPAGFHCKYRAKQDTFSSANIGHKQIC